MTLKVERPPEVIKRTGRSRSSIYLGIEDGTFPKPVKLGARSIGWPSTVIDAGYAPKKFQAAWGKWIKQSGINDIDLQRLITAAESFRGRYCPRGIARKALIARIGLSIFSPLLILSGLNRVYRRRGVYVSP